MKNLKSLILHLKSLLKHLLPVTWFNKLSSQQKFIVRAALGALLIILIPLALYSLRHPDKALGAWFDSNYLFRKAITVTNINTATVNNLQYLLTIDTSTLISQGKLQGSCQDLRFTDQQGKAIPYYIDSGCNTTTTKVWVYIWTLPGDSTTAMKSTIYMYYGNPSANAGSSASQFDNLVGLQAYWTFNDDAGTGVNDASAYSNNGIWNGTLGSQWSTTAVASTSGSFNASDNRVIVKNSTSLSFGTGPFTYEAWLYKGNFNTRGDFMSHKTADGTYDFGFFVNTDNKVYLYQNSCNTFAISVSTIAQNTWYHIGITRTAAGAWTLYINGNQDITGTCSTTLTNATDWWFGSNHDGSLNPTVPWSGKMDDIHMYNTTRTAQQISTDYTQSYAIASYPVQNGGVTPSFATEEQGPGPIAYWKFDDGTGTTAKNSASGGGTTVTNLLTNPSFETNTTGWFNPGSILTSLARDTSVAKFGTASIQAVAPASGDRRVQLNPQITILANTKYTVSAWFYSATAMTVALQEADSGGVIASSPDIVLAPNVWTYLTATGTSSTGTGVYVQLRDDGGAGTYNIDGVQLEQAPAASQYCDGSNPNNLWSSASWTGTANASSSVCVGNPSGLLTNMSTSPSATNSGWIQSQQCISGNCLAFDGIDDQVSVSASYSAQTINMWVNPASSSANLMQLNTSQDIYVSAGSVSTDGIVNAKVYVNGNLNGTVTANKWNYVTVVSGVPIYANNIIIGTTWRGPFKGFLDEVKVYPYQRTPTQVTTDYNARGSVLGTSNTTLAQNSTLNNGLVGYWKMDEATWSGTVNEILDSSGNGANGTAEGPTNNKSYPAPGKFGNGGKFDGIDNYSDVANESIIQR